MEKLMWKYLDGAYPHVYYKMTKFGRCLEDGDNLDEVVLGINMVKQLVSLFDCSDEDGHSVVKKWLEARPEYENILNSTNPHVLIAKFS